MYSHNLLLLRRVAGLREPLFEPGELHVELLHVVEESLGGLFLAAYQ